MKNRWAIANTAIRVLLPIIFAAFWLGYSEGYVACMRDLLRALNL